MTDGDDQGTAAGLPAGLRDLVDGWPPREPPDGDYRRAPLGGTRLVAATLLPAGGAIALASGGSEGGWSLVPVVRAGAGWRRATAGDGVAADLVQALRDGRPLDGGFAVVPGPGFVAERLGRGSERSLGTDQTNETVVVDERVGVKWLLHPDPARERAPRLLHHLAAAGFRELPPFLGSLVWHGLEVEVPVTVAQLDGWLPDARDGWEWGTDAVLVHAAAGHRCGPGCPAGFGAELGALTARLHRALATPTSVFPDPVEVADAGTVTGWALVARRTLDEAIERTATDDPDAAAELRAMGLDALLGGLDGADAVAVQPVHGDLHVGQVLRGPHGLSVIDLDGNPTLDAAAIQAPAPAARDVASLVCSLDHTGRVAIRRGADGAVVEAWIGSARAALLAAYRDGLAAAGRSELFDERLLRPFMVEQECRELIYSARFLPRWRYAPMGALRAMVGG
jgi:maltokinase